MNAILGDITTLKRDAIVNTANSSLLGGGGVDGAIHRAAGSDLLHECRLLGGSKTGQAKITGGYQLPAGNIIHTVGPVWNGGSKNEDELLASCYRNSLELCMKHDLHSVAFPCISTGIFRFPRQRAAEIAVTTCQEFLTDHSDFALEITFCCFANEDLNFYQSLLDQ
jgi:O-acetyl-ADP-ribose deacetylase (regulator of RNase III)